jgi:hypothetical protein
MTDKQLEKLRLKVEPISDAQVDQDIAVLETLKSGYGVIQKAVNETKALIMAQAPDEPVQGVFSFMPTHLTRISPFVPMSRRELKDHKFKGAMEWETSWGKLTVESGNECLSIGDETVLLSLLELVKEKETDALEVSTYQLAKLIHKNPNKTTYNSLWGSLSRLMKTVIRLEIWQGKGKPRKLDREMMGNMVSFAERNHTTNVLTVVMNTYFLKMFGAGFITNLDLKLRAGLKGDIAKSLYRFYQGQRDYEYRCHMLTLAKTINLDMTLQNTEIRKRIRKGLSELKRSGYLTRWTMPKDIVTVWKSAKPARLG